MAIIPTIVKINDPIVKNPITKNAQTIDNKQEIINVKNLLIVNDSL